MQLHLTITNSIDSQQSILKSLNLHLLCKLRRWACHLCRWLLLQQLLCLVWIPLHGSGGKQLHMHKLALYFRNACHSKSMLIFLLLTLSRREHIRSSHPSCGGSSGIKSQSAPDARADTKAKYLEYWHR